MNIIQRYNMQKGKSNRYDIEQNAVDNYIKSKQKQREQLAERHNIKLAEEQIKQIAEEQIAKAIRETFKK